MTFASPCCHKKIRKRERGKKEGEREREGKRKKERNYRQKRDWGTEGRNKRKTLPRKQIFF